MEYSESSFSQGETPRGKWQARHSSQQSRQGWLESYAYAQSSGNGKTCEVVTETEVQDSVIFQVSPDGTVTIVQPLSTYSYSSARCSH